MTLAVHTARISYSGPDRLDVTRKSAGPEGLPFAPSWQILGPMLRGRRRENGPAGAPTRGVESAACSPRGLVVLLLHEPCVLSSYSTRRDPRQARCSPERRALVVVDDLLAASLERVSAVSLGGRA